MSANGPSAIIQCSASTSFGILDVCTRRRIDKPNAKVTGLFFHCGKIFQAKNPTLPREGTVVKRKNSIASRPIRMEYMESARTLTRKSLGQLVFLRPPPVFVLWRLEVPGAYVSFATALHISQRSLVVCPCDLRLPHCICKRESELLCTCSAKKSVLTFAVVRLSPWPHVTVGRSDPSCFAED